MEIISTSTTVTPRDAVPTNGAERPVNINTEPLRTIRLAIVARHQFDGDAWSALFQARAEFRVLCATSSLATAGVVCRHREPDVVLLDAALLDGPTGVSLTTLLEQIGNFPTMVLDTEVNGRHLAAVLAMPSVGYFTRSTTFPQIAAGMVQLAQGERAFCPSVDDRLLRTTKGWQLRRNESSSPLSLLTPREIEVLRLIAQGNTIKDCASLLRLSPSTVDNHKSRLMKKLGVHRSLELTRLAIREGLVSV